MAGAGSSDHVGYSLGPGSAEDIPGGVAPWAQRAAPRDAPQNRMPGNLIAVAQPGEIPVIDASRHTFVVPQKRIDSRLGIDQFLQGPAGQAYLAFVANLNAAIRGKKLSDPVQVSPACDALLSLLQTLRGWIAEFPPRQVAARYGNPAYREWHEKLETEGPRLIAAMLPPDLQPAVVELAPYLEDSFGNAIRIDYGSGHEVNFTAWLLCLTRLGFLKPSDYHALAAPVFSSYLALMRELQTTYWLEPAGSHGVWGLDDYHFIPFILGSSQLVGHKFMKPKSIHTQDILDQFANEYYYYACVAFTKKVKKGPVAEHSPMINDISGVASWEKVNSGMLKMYRAEVLEKVPIMQHFLFGSLLPWEY